MASLHNGREQGGGMTQTARFQVPGSRPWLYAAASAVALALVLAWPLLAPVFGHEFRFRMLLLPALFTLCLFALVGGFVSLLSGTLTRAQRRLEDSLASLRASEERFRTMFELASVGKAEIDLAGRFLRVNRRLCEITGYAAEELLALRSVDLTHADDREDELAAFRRFAAGQINEYTSENRYRRKDGTIVWVQVTAALSRDAQGDPHSSIAVVYDITDRKQAEQALEQRARHAALVADIGVALNGSDTARDMLQRCAEAIVRHLDAAFARIWTLEGDTSVLELQASAGMYTHLDGAHSCVPVGSPFKIGWIAAERKPHLTNAVIGDPQISDQEWAKREGMVAFAGYPLVVEDRLVGVMAMFARAPLSESALAALGSVANEIALDIERRQVETALRESEERFRLRTLELEKANKELEAFSHTLSHDLRNSLGVIQNYSHVLLTACADKLDKRNSDCLHRVRAVTVQMAQTIDDLLQFSLARRSELQRESVDLSALAETLVAELREMDPDRQVTVTIAPGLTATGDRGLLRVLLRNLLGNAWKFTAKTSGARIEFGTTDHDSRVTTHESPIYFVRDNGAGFDMAKAHKLFGAFQRLHTAREFPGTGIGLATVQRIVQRHGGRVWADAAAGKGAVFYFTL